MRRSFLKTEFLALRPIVVVIGVLFQFGREISVKLLKFERTDGKATDVEVVHTGIRPTTRAERAIKLVHASVLGVGLLESRRDILVLLERTR